MTRQYVATNISRIAGGIQPCGVSHSILIVNGSDNEPVPNPRPEDRGYRVSNFFGGVVHQRNMESLAAKGVRVVAYEGWQKIDAAEIESGAPLGKPREKFLTVAEMLAASRI